MDISQGKTTSIMEQTSVEKRLKSSCEDDNKGTMSAKRMKPGSVTGKSVVVLRHSDITMGKSSVLMPNTIEMAQLKKPTKGQFKRDIQLSSNMSELDVRRTLIEHFPILTHQRFCCAAAADNRTRLDFHGEPRIWDGHSIRRKIKGNSALYILIEKEYQQSECHSWESEQSSSELDRDRISTEELSARSISDTTQVEMSSRHSVNDVPNPGLEKQAIPGNPLKPQLTSYPIMRPGLAQQTSDEKINDNLQQTEGQLMRRKTMDKFPPQQGFVLVASQRGMLPSVHHASITTIHSMTNARDVVTMATSSLPQPLPMGSIMVPGGGIAVAQPGVIANQAVSSASIVAHPGLIGGKATSTASNHQSLGNTVFHVAKGPGAWHAGLPIVSPMNMMVPQMSSLNISSATTQQLQKQGIVAEKSTGMRDQDTQTEATEAFQQAPPIPTWQQSGNSYPAEYSNKTLVQEGARSKCPHQSRQSHNEKTNTSQVMEKGACLNTADEGRHHHSFRVLSDYESQGSDQTDSGMETADTTEGPAIDGLSLLCDAAKIRSVVTKKKSIVAEICPKESSIRGGDMFILILNEPLPSATDEGCHAIFGNSAPVVLKKANPFSLKGTIPAYHSPGVVTVEVVSSTGSYVGQTSFTYIDVVDYIFGKLEHDQELHRRFFYLMTQELRKALRTPEKEQPLPAIPGLKSPEQIENLEDKNKRNCEESDYDADDEESDDAEVSYNKGWNPNSRTVAHDDIIERTGHREGIGQPFRPPSVESVYPRFRHTGDGQEEEIQILCCIFIASSDSQDLNNVTRHSFNARESGASIREVEPSAIPSKSSDKVAGAAFDNSGIARYNSQSSERTNNPENMDIDSQLNNVDVDQNLVVDKTRLADKRSGDEDDDPPANPL